MKTVVIVTGATSGIGRATAIALAESGIDLVITGRRSTELESLAALCRAHQVSLTSVQLDLTDGDAPQSLVEAARRGFPDAYPVLINNAGTAESGDFATMSPEKVQSQIEINLIAPMRLTQAILPWMLEQKGGQILNVLSVTTVQVFGGMAAYSAAKAGLFMFGKVIAAEYRRKGIRVSAVLPGATDTPLWDAQSFKPKLDDMMPATAVAEILRDLVLMPRDRNIDEMLLMPPRGVL